MHQDLSPREREAVRLVAEGKTNREIALETRPRSEHSERVRGERLPQGRRNEPRCPDRMVDSSGRGFGMTPPFGGSQREGLRRTDSRLSTAHRLCFSRKRTTI